MSKRGQMLKVSVTERLDDIFLLMERTIAEYEEELCEVKEENRRKQQLLDSARSHRTSGLIQETPQIKEEPQERVGSMRALVTERLTAAAEEIFALVERTIAEYEEELCRSKEENQRKQQLLEEVLKPRGAVTPTEPAVSGLKQENCDDLHIHVLQVKEEALEEHPLSPLQQDAGVTMETDTGSEENSTDINTELVQNWMVPLNEDDDESSGHEVSVFPKQNRIKCSLCRKTFAQQCQLKRHMASHSCPLCQKVCPKKSLKVHMMLHTGELPFQCPQCDKRLRSKAVLNAHVKMHAQGRPFSCSVCGTTFKSNHHLMRHMYQHTGRRAYGCPLCDQSFKRKWQLDGHMSLKHTDA